MAGKPARICLPSGVVRASDKNGGLGLRSGEVRLVPYDDAWPACFVRERAQLAAALGPLAGAIEHIGSTAVPGLPAKPVLDIAIQVTTFRDLPAIAKALASAGYESKGEYGLPGRQFFTRGDPVTHHVHVVEAGSPHWAEWKGLRDHLRANAADREAYAAAKRDLAARFARDRASYTMGKNPIMQALRARRAESRIKA